MQANLTLKGNEIFYNALLEQLFISKEISMMEFLASTHGTQEMTQTIRWNWKPIIFWLGQFEGPTEVQLDSWWKAASLWSMSS